MFNKNSNSNSSNKNNGINSGVRGLTPMEQESFLSKQIELRQSIMWGDATWDDMNKLFSQYGMPQFTSDSLRRMYKIYDMYYDAGWVNKPVKDYNSNPAMQKVTTEYNAKTKVTSSEKLVSLTDIEIKDSDTLLKAHGFNPSVFELISAKNSKWQIGCKKSEDGVKNLYSSKISVKPKFNGLDLDEVVKHFENFIPPMHNLVKDEDAYIRRDYLLFPLYDLHWGRVCVEQEGYKYNREIARESVIKSIKTFFDRNFEVFYNEIYLIVGQDYFNSSFTGYTSSQRHLQNNDCNYKDMFNSGSELLIEICEMIKQKCNLLNIVFVEGNHSTAEEFYLGKLIEAYYKNSNDVIVEAGGEPRKYLDLDNTCVGLSHGCKEKDRIYTLMQTEVPILWGNTEYHFWLLGHLHTYQSIEKDGVTLYRCDSPVVPDGWSVAQGYTASIQRFQLFVVDREEGLIEIHNINVKPNEYT